MFYCYIFQCADGTLYCGSTSNLQNREKLHNTGRGAKYTKIHGKGKIIYSETHTTIGDAMRREIQIKKLPRPKKLALINNQRTKTIS